MKTFFTLISAVAFSATMFAQFNDMIFQRPSGSIAMADAPKINPIINVGANLSTWTTSGPYSYNFGLGYQVGVVLSTTEDKKIRIEPGINLFQKRILGKTENEIITLMEVDGSFKSVLAKFMLDNSFAFSYIQIPVNLRVNFDIGGLRLSTGVGIYGGVRAFGHIKMTSGPTEGAVVELVGSPPQWVETGEVVMMESINIKRKVADMDARAEFRYNPFDIGGQIFVDLTVGQYGVALGYQRGFMSVVPKGEWRDYVGKHYNNSFYLTLSYKLRAMDY
jgi:hypothetical protein